jgi:diguanylate cyclase
MTISVLEVAAACARPALLTLATAAFLLIAVVARQQARIRTLRREAEHDSLTGVFNRRGWDRALRGATRRSKGGDVLVCVADLVGLKKANEEGHAAGDALIRRAASGLQEVAQRGDVVARVGGDEFTLLALSYPGREPANFATRVEAALAARGVAAVSAAASSATCGSVRRAWSAADEALASKRLSGRQR